MKKAVFIIMSALILIVVIVIGSFLTFNQNKDEAGKYWEQGNLKNENKDYEGAIEEYTKAIKIDPGYFPAYICRADTEKILKQNKQALKDCDSAIWNWNRMIMYNYFFHIILF